MFHLELRQFPHQTREFNLTREQLEARVVGPWVRGELVALGDRRWDPERAKLAIYEGRALATEEIGMGRGWANATRTGEEVTARVLAEAQEGGRPPLAELKQAVLARCTGTRLDAHEVVELVGDGPLPARASERLALAEQAVWELLHERKVELVREGATLEPEAWRAALISWATWSGRDRGSGAVFLERAPDSPRGGG